MIATAMLVEIPSRLRGSCMSCKKHLDVTVRFFDAGLTATSSGLPPSSDSKTKQMWVFHWRICLLLAEEKIPDNGIA